MALTRRELEERARGYAVIVNGRIVKVICEECRKQFWGGLDERIGYEDSRRIWEIEGRDSQYLLS